MTKSEKANWFKIWTEDAKKDKDDGQFYLRLMNMQEDRDIYLAVVKSDGEIYERNIICHLNEHRKAFMFHTVDEDLPLKTDLFGIPMRTDHMEMRTKENGYRGNAIQIPLDALEKMTAEARAEIDSKMGQHEKETKHWFMGGRNRRKRNDCSIWTYAILLSLGKLITDQERLPPRH